MEQKKVGQGSTEPVTKKDIFRFVILSVIGIFLYFIPVKGSKVLVVVFVDMVKAALGEGLRYVVLLMLAALVCTIIGAKVFKLDFCIRLHKEDSNAKLIHYLVAFLVVLAVWSQIPPAAIFSDPDIGGQILGLAGTVMLTVSICGWFIVFILKSGIVEFAGTLLEPLMRPLFKLPGAAAVNCLSSYVVSAAVGVYMTDQYYESKVYDRKEAVAAATCFSTISVGYIGVLCSLGEMNDRYGLLLALTFVLMVVMTAITVRIWPIAQIPRTYVDGTSSGDGGKAHGEQAEEGDGKAAGEEMQGKDIAERSRMRRAITSAARKSREFTTRGFLDSFLSALRFSQRIIAYMIPIVLVTLTLVHLTPVFTWLGYPIAPVLRLLGLPDAARVAPAVLLGFIEVSLPVISVSTGVAAQSVFFVILLSIIQIIFMTEAGNAMLGAKFGLKIQDLVILFLVRTAIAVPIVAGISHLLF